MSFHWPIALVTWVLKLGWLCADAKRLNVSGEDVVIQ